VAVNKSVSKGSGRRTRARTNVVQSERRLTVMCGERRELMRADAVLRCIAVALEYDGWTSDEPDYAEAIDVARHLISRSIERLESRGSPTTRSVRSGSESST
jgi:hypothetical protein